MKKAICFGEILWDKLPTGKQPGGAPMNVAYHLNKLGVNAAVISRLGNDDDGAELKDFLKQSEIPAHFIQTDLFYPTSTVNVVVDDAAEVAYEIVYPVAWDYIASEEKSLTEIANAHAFVFGSLASRNAATRLTLMQMLETAKFKVLDVNLRPPHYNKNTLQELLRKTDLLKLNFAELDLLGGMFTSFSTTTDYIKGLQDKFDIEEVLLTKGIEGCSYYNREIKLDETIYEVKVADTVGSGDSFLAAFLAKKMSNQPIADCLLFATALSAFVTGKKGACPVYNLSDIEDFLRTAVKRK